MPIDPKTGATAAGDYTAGSNAAPMKPENATTTAYPAGTSQSTINTQVAAQQGTPSSTARPGERNTTLESTNRQKMLASGELKADTNPQLAQEKINLFTYGVENPTFGPTISSDATRTDLAKKTDEVNKGLASTQQAMTQLPTPDYKLYSDYTQEYEKARAAGKDIYESTVQSIQKDFEIRQQVQADENRVNAGFQAKTLARMNALGTGASGLSFLQQVDVQNQREMNKLLVQKGQVLIQAAEAAQAKDIDLLGKLVTESHAITDQFNKVQSQRLADSIMTNNQLMEQNRFGWQSQDRASKKLSDLAAIETPLIGNEKQIKQLETDAGLPTGYFTNLSKVVAEQKTATTEKARIENEKNINAIRNDTPSDQSFKIGDIVYTGWKKDQPTWQSIQTDSNGDVSVVYYDPVGKTYKTVPMGNIGTPTSGFTVVDDGQGNLYNHNSKTGETSPIQVKGGYADPSILDGFNEWASKMGTITTPFGSSTKDPSNPGGGEAFHPGIDITHPGAKSGQYTVDAFIPSNGQGKIIEVHDIPNDSPYGRYVKVQDSEGRIWQYSHMASIGVKVGDSINNEAYLGMMGNSGGVFSKSGGDGTHLDLRVQMPNQQINKAKLTPAQQEAEVITGQTKAEGPASGQVDKFIQDEVMKKINSGLKVGIDNTALRGYAADYADTGKLATDAPKWASGIIKDAAKMLVEDGTVVSKTTGVKPSGAGKAQLEGLAAAYNLVKTELPALQEAYNNIGISFHIPKSEGFRSDAEQHYMDLYNQVLGDYALAVSGKVVNENELKRLQDQFPKAGFNFKGTLKVEDFTKKLNQSLGDHLDFLGYEIKGFNPRGTSFNPAEADQG